VSPSHNFASKSNCRDTTVFLTPNKEAVKCFSFLEGGPAEAFAKALKEFCFLKIASGLGVGPKLGSSIGFDLLISQNCVEFAME
jgi:serine/threonine protein kinase